MVKRRAAQPRLDEREVPPAEVRAHEALELRAHWVVEPVDEGLNHERGRRRR